MWNALSVECVCDLCSISASIDTFIDAIGIIIVYHITPTIQHSIQAETIAIQRAKKVQWEKMAKQIFVHSSETEGIWEWDEGALGVRQRPAHNHLQL